MPTRSGFPLDEPVLQHWYPPWTLHRSRPDHAWLQPASQCARIDYPKPDGQLTFDRLSSVFVSNTNHAENQPAHLTLKDSRVPVATNLALYGGPESRYCLAGVYEFVKTDGGEERLQINAQTAGLQDLRHRGPDTAHRLGHPRGRRPNYAGM